MSRIRPFEAISDPGCMPSEHRPIDAGGYCNRSQTPATRFGNRATLFGRYRETIACSGPAPGLWQIAVVTIRRGYSGIIAGRRDSIKIVALGDHQGTRYHRGFYHVG